MTLEELEQKALKKEGTYNIENGDYKCGICNTDILGISILFPIHDGPFTMSGSGKVFHQNFPYCPKCEKRPEIYGLPIKV